MKKLIAYARRESDLQVYNACTGVQEPMMLWEQVGEGELHDTGSTVLRFTKPVRVGENIEVRGRPDGRLRR